MINKTKLIQNLILQLENDLLMTKEAARVAHDAATNEESKPENEYDTRALEASYLAGAQAKRAREIDEALSFFRNVQVKTFSKDDSVAATALVELKSQNKKSFILMMPVGGGINTSFDNHVIQVITPVSVLGEALVGLKVGEVAEVEIGSTIREYEILGIW